VKGLPDRIDLVAEFESFKAREAQAWKDSGREPEKDSCLVPPSGSLDSILAHHLHQASFTTKSFHTTDAADSSNGCVAMVMGNAFEKGKTLLFDHLHRRSRKSEGLIKYPAAVLKVHEEFTLRITGSSAAKAEIVYGRPVQNRVLKTIICDILPLWDRFEGILLVMVHEQNFHNAEQHFKFRKVLLCVAHPQRMFYEQTKSLISIRQDLTMEVASLITGVNVDLEYYQLKRWPQKMPTLKDEALSRAEELTQSLSLRATTGRFDRRSSYL